MRRFCILMLGASLALSAGPAWADEDGGGHSDCREVEDEAQCSDEDFSPTFERSPVQTGDIVICAPLSTCNTKPPEEGTRPASFIPPDPSKIGENIIAMGKLITDFATGLLTLIV